MEDTSKIPVEKSQRLVQLMAAANLLLLGTNAVAAAPAEKKPPQQVNAATIEVLDENDIVENYHNSCCGNCSCSCNASC